MVEVADFGRLLQQFPCEFTRYDFIDGQISILEVGNQVIGIAVVVENLPNSHRRLIVCRPVCLNKNRMQHIERAALVLRIIRLVVHEDQQRVPQPENLLACRFERARRLRLPDTRDLHVDFEIGEVDALC